MASVDENMAGATLVAVATENATSVSVDDERFEVADGNLKLKDDMSLDFEGDDGGSVDVTITASGDGDSAMHTVTVTINDVQEASMIEVRDQEIVPVKGVNTSLTIDENTVHDGKGGAPLALIAVTDPDAADPTTGDDAVAAVSIGGDMAEYFQVILDPEEGLWLAMTDGTTFDYETVGGEIMLTVTYTDSAGEMVSTDVTVTINDVNEAPAASEDEVPDAVFVGGEENSMTVDLKALFSDPDGDVLTYRLSDNAPDWLTFSVTTSGSHHDQTIMGTISGTAPDGSDMSVDGISIIAMDAGGETAEATFDVVVDDENDAPSRVELRVTEDDGTVVRVTAVEVDENAKGAVLGKVRVTDEDDARHPHGQHMYTFEVDGEADDRFEVTEDGYLKLKDDESLNHEANAEFSLKITATDMYVTAPGEDEDPTTGSASQSITVTVKDVDAGDGPVALQTIGDWWVTVDDDLDAEDVRDGDWLSFGLDTTGSDAAFTDEDGDDLTYEISVESSDGTVVDWLQISDSGKITNKADVLPERGVYTVTVTATDEGDNSARTSFTLAVALSDENDRDNDRPDIRDVEEYEYVEGSGSQKVASFSVRDDDVAIAPHPYGVLKVELSGAMSDRFKVMEVGRDEDSVHYEIHTKSAAELAVDDKGMPLRTPLTPLDHETADEVDITVTVTDAADYPDVESRTDDKVITIDIEDAADEAPVFSQATIADDQEDARWAVSRTVDRVTKAGTTKITVDQEQDQVVIVVQLFEVWDDPDTDVDELEFDVDGTGSLPDWITVYGPDEWEEIYDRRDDVNEGDAPSEVRDGDQVVVIVIDRSAADGENVDLSGASFTISAEDDENNSTTETISIAVKDTNVGITPGDDDVVSINGDPEGIAPLSIGFDASQDPDIAGGTHPVLVVYTWSHDNATPADATDDVIVSVSSTPQTLVLDANRDRTNDYVGRKVTAKVEYYEIDPETGAVADVQTYMAVSDTIEAQDPPDPVTSVSMDLVTSDGGVTAAITTTGAASETTGAARLEASTNGESGWITVDTTAADTSGGSANAELDVNENADATEGDGGGLYYRVVYTYTDDDDDSQTAMSEVIQLGDVARPTGLTDAGGGTTNIISATTPAAGETIRIDNQGNDVDVQWQMLSSRPGSMWTDLDGETGLELDVTSAHAGNMLRAKVTYTADDDATTTDVDEEGWVEWVEYTEVLTVSGATADTDPATVQANHVLRVELDQKSSAPGAVQKAKVATFDASSLFFDADGDDLTYTITTVAPDLDSPATAADAPGTDADLGAGGSVYRVYSSVWNETDSAAETTDNVEQSFTINKDTGMVTYVTDKEQGHDGNTDDGQGNTLTFTISAMDAAGTPATATVMARINVTPTAIELQSIQTDGTTAEGTAANLPAPGMGVTGTPLIVQDGANTPDDADTDSDMLTFTDDEEYTARKVADIDVMDQNLTTDKFGTHEITLSGRGANMFEVRETDTGDTNGSTWEIWLKDDAVFDFEALKNARTEATATSITLSITVTAKDGGGLQTKGVFSVVLVDADTDDDPETTTPTAPDAPDPEVPGLEDDADDSDNDGPVIPPDDGGAFIDDLLDQFVITIDDIDIA